MDNAGGSFEPLPDGDYDCAIESANSKTSSNGKLMFECKFTVTSGPHNNRKIWNNFVISPENPNALSFFFQHMNVLGLGQDFFASNPPPEHVAQALVGRTCRLKVGRRTWNGQIRNEVKAVMPAISGVGLGGPVMQGPAPAATPPQPAPAPPPPAPAPAPQPVAAQAPPPPSAPAPVAAPVSTPAATAPSPSPEPPPAPPAPAPEPQQSNGVPAAPPVPF